MLRICPEHGRKQALSVMPSLPAENEDTIGSIPDQSGAVELSVVIPCLNEADTLGSCIEKVQSTLAANQLGGEVIVADNGSTDGSAEIAKQLGAVVVAVSSEGYGHALMGGIAIARGKFIIMGDADGSYDFAQIPRFLEKLREGYELAQGCRLPKGGGEVLAGAMPFLHRWCGNPFLSLLARHWFRTQVHDVYCGMRGFRTDSYKKLGQRCTGMEFATEMIVKASLFGLHTAEVPITLHPDGRKRRASHLRTFRDGWRTLRFLLIYSPRWLFLIPGATLILFGILGYCVALPGMTIGHVRFDAHTLLFSSLAILCGYESIIFAVLTKTFAMGEGLIPEDPRLSRFSKIAKLEHGLLIALLALALGLGLLLEAVNQWRLAEFGDLNYATTMRWVIPGATLIALGFQTVLFSFFISILGLHRR